MKSSYMYLVFQEVEEAKKMVDEDAMNALNGWTQDSKEMVKLSEAKIQEHLKYYEQDIIEESRSDNSFDDL